MFSREGMSEKELSSYLKLSQVLYEVSYGNTVKVLKSAGKEVLFDGSMIRVDQSGILEKGYLVSLISAKNNQLVLEVF